MTTSTKGLKHLQDKCPALKIYTDPADCWAYGGDYSRRHVLPLAVVFPHTHDEVVHIVKTCYHYRIPLVARGRGTGTPGGAVAVKNGIVLSTEYLNQIIQIDPANRIAHVMPGVINRDLQQALKAQGFFWAPDPSSAIACTIGGNLAYNSAGPRAVKYGTCRENTLKLKAVTGSGETIEVGANTTKGVVGYDLARLLIGSEGTLAIITEASLKLTPCPSHKALIQVLYKSEAAAGIAVAQIMAQTVTPCALELMDSACLDLLRQRANLSFDRQAHALLFVEIDGSKSQIEQDLQILANACQHPDLFQLHQAHSHQEQHQLWQARRALSPCLKDIAPKKINEDIVVPITRLAEFIAFTRELAQLHHIHIVNFGHAGNGNLHVNLLIDPNNPQQAQAAEYCLREIFTKVLQLGGTLSGEHGVGLDKQAFIAQELDPTSLMLMGQIKQVFDPHNILNPGKMLPLTD